MSISKFLRFSILSVLNLIHKLINRGDFLNTHNRIKELRKKNKLTLDQMSELVGIKRGTLNNYENEKTEPKLKTWENLATFFKVPITYIQGLSNDEEGWKEWEKNTGLTQKQIKKEIETQKSTGEITSSMSTQQQIQSAVNVLMGSGTKDLRVVESAYDTLFELEQRINTSYFGSNKVDLLNLKQHSSSNKEPNDVYKDLINIIQSAKNDIQNLKNRYNLS